MSSTKFQNVNQVNGLHAPALGPGKAARFRQERELTVPRTKGERERILKMVHRFAERLQLTPTLVPQELEDHAGNLLHFASVPERYRDFTKVLINNEAWREVIAAIPFERRTLLLPPCLRSKHDCPAEFDELGLLCENCGRCPIGELQKEAETLGYTVLIVEGTNIVANFIEEGVIDAVLGVSCMDALGKAFPYLTANAIPGIAVPLL